MKKIIISLGIIGVVAAIATGVTIAFFNDTETSTGNIFVAGDLDLKVDHTVQTYNGVDCKTCSVTVVSDTSDMVIEKNGGAVTPYPAVLAWVHPAWTAQNDPSLLASSAKWIWEQNPTQQADTTVDASYSFKKEFVWMGPIVSTDLFMAVGSDNGVQVYLNNVLIGSNTGEFGYLQGSMLQIPAINITSNIIQGNNVLKFVVTNMGLPNGTPYTNPAGLIYKFSIDGNCGDEYFQNHCELWQATDLNGQQQFFNFDDVKPGDYGTNVISLHVDSNDAYVCLLTSNENDQDNTLVEPELDLSDTGPVGELSQFIKVFAWDDADNDGVYEGEAQLLAPNTPIVDIELLQLSLTGGGTAYVGLAWCAGTQTVVGNTISCNGATMGDITQTDSFSADLTAYAEQQRNNDDFDCEEVVLQP